MQLFSPKYAYLFLGEFVELRDILYADLPCCSLEGTKDRLSIKEMTVQDITLRINPKSTMFPELLEEQYASKA